MFLHVTLCFDNNTQNTLLRHMCLSYAAHVISRTWTLHAFLSAPHLIPSPDCLQCKDGAYLAEFVTSGKLNDAIDGLKDPLINAAIGHFTASEVPVLDECKKIMEALIECNTKFFRDTRDKLAASVARTQAELESLVAAPPLTARTVQRLSGLKKAREMIDTLREELNQSVGMGLSHSSYVTQSARDVINSVERYCVTVKRAALFVLEQVVNASKKSRKPEPVERFLALLEQYQVVGDKAEEVLAPARQLLQQIAEEQEQKLSLMKVRSWLDGTDPPETRHAC